MDDCEICGGARKIRLPIRRKLSVRPAIDSKIEYQESSREYACPECSNVVDDNRVIVMGAQESYPPPYAEDPSIMDSIRRGMARPLADMLIRDGFVRFVDGPTTDYGMRKSLRAYVGVVAVGAAKRIEDRINERQFEVAEQVIDEAARQISIWGSHYSGDEGHIRKGQAVQEMRDALKVAKMKPAGNSNAGG